MVLLIDIGNTNIVFGISDGEKIISIVRTETVKKAEFDYVPVIQDLLYRKEKIEKTDGAILSSVVPEVTGKVEKAVFAVYGVHALSADDAVRHKLIIDIDSPDKLGMDLKADAIAALKKYPCPQLIFDLGTATTCSVLNEQGHYLGGAIMPGLKLSLKALVASASQLPMIECSTPITEYIGKNTQSAMRVGTLFGHALMLEGFAREIQKQFTKPLHIVLTGGLSHIVKRHMTVECVYDPNLTLDGLLYLYQSAC